MTILNRNEIKTRYQLREMKKYFGDAQLMSDSIYIQIANKNTSVAVLSIYKHNYCKFDRFEPLLKYIYNLTQCFTQRGSKHFCFQRESNWGRHMTISAGQRLTH